MPMFSTSCAMLTTANVLCTDQLFATIMIITIFCTASDFDHLCANAVFFAQCEMFRTIVPLRSSTPAQIFAFFIIYQNFSLYSLRSLRF